MMNAASFTSSAEDLDLLSTCAAYTLDSTADSHHKAMDHNSSYRLHTSHCSSLSSDSDLSLSIDRELSLYTSKIIDSDELPAFEIRLISPLGRTPSPIDSDFDFQTPTKCHTTPKRDVARQSPNYREDNPDFITLQDINAQISPPSDSEAEPSAISRTDSLETIFEGVFLNTPPRQRLTPARRSTLLEKVTRNRLHYGKENVLPASNETQSKLLATESSDWVIKNEEVVAEDFGSHIKD